MPRYLIDAYVEIKLENVQVEIDDDQNNFLSLLGKALIEKLNHRLTLLDFRGARTGDDGIVTDIKCKAVINWTRED